MGLEGLEGEDEVEELSSLGYDSPVPVALACARVGGEGKAEARRREEGSRRWLSWTQVGWEEGEEGGGRL